MNRLIAAAMLLTLLAGCAETAPTAWDEAPLTYVCTDAQMARVQSESGWCTANTDYTNMYCYGSAFMRNCTPRPAAPAAPAPQVGWP